MSKQPGTSEMRWKSEVGRAEGGNPHRSYLSSAGKQDYRVCVNQEGPGYNKQTSSVRMAAVPPSVLCGRETSLVPCYRC